MHHHHHHRHGGFGGFPFFGGPGMGMGMGGGLLSDLLAGGLGYFIGSNMQARRNQQYPQYQQPAAANPSSTKLAQLDHLGRLRESGVLTEEEFQIQKRRILNEY